MKGIVLGSGTGIPSLTRNAAGYHLEAGGLALLIDCGSGTLRRLERARKNFANLDAIFITHIHPDHVSDLTPLVHALKLPGLRRVKPLHVFGPPGFIEFFKNIVAPVAPPPSHFPFEVHEAQAQWTLHRITIRSWPTVHSDRVPSVAYRFELDGRSVVFSGDCDYDQTLIDGARDVDLLILDCSTLDSGKMAGHLSAGLAGLIAANAGAKRLMPTHFYPIPASDAVREEECRIQFSGPIIMAEDLLEFEV